MKNQGITILQIVIVIVIMIILSTYTILFGQGIPNEAQISSIYTEIREIKNVISEGQILNKIKVQGDTLEFYGEITAPKVENSKYEKVLNGDSLGTYYYLDFTSSRNLENVLELENIQHDYLLDWENKNLYLIKGIEMRSGNEINIKYNADEIEQYYNNALKK